MAKKKRRRKRSAVEYAALCDEINRLHAGVRAMWGAVFAVYFAAIIACGAPLIVLEGRIADAAGGIAPLDRFVQHGGVNWIAAVLAGIVLAGLVLGYSWLRHAAYLAAYVTARFEAPGGRLRQATADRPVESPVLRRARRAVPSTFAVSMLPLIILPAALTLLGPIRSMMLLGPRLHIVMVAALMLDLLLLGLCVVRMVRFAQLPEQRREMDMAWHWELSKQATPPSENAAR